MLNGFEGIAETPFGEFVRENVIKHLTQSPICLGENSWLYGVDYSRHKEVTKKKDNGQKKFYHLRLSTERFCSIAGKQARYHLYKTCTQG